MSKRIDRDFMRPNVRYLLVIRRRTVFFDYLIFSDIIYFEACSKYARKFLIFELISAQILNKYQNYLLYNLIFKAGLSESIACVMVLGTHVSGLQRPEE